MSKANSSSTAPHQVDHQLGPQIGCQVGLYGGSFDPIHHGHLLLARDALEQLHLDRIIFIPAALSPHKTHTPPAPAADRWDLLLEAISGESRFQADDVELRRSGPSFTIDTVRHYRQLYPATRFFYFLGEDNIPEIHTWKEIDALGELVTFVLLARPGAPTLPPQKSLLPGQSALSPRLPRRVEISSSEIRNRIASGLSVRYMVPDSVMHLILSRHLYVR